VTKVSRIKKTILQEIMDRLGVKKSRAYERIHEVRREFNFTIDLPTAAYILAARLGVDISKHNLSDEELEKVRKLSMVAPPVLLSKKESSKRRKKPSYIKIGEREIEDSILPSKLLREAEEMSEIYKLLYIFENSLRYIIMRTMEKRFGKDWWKHVSRKIREKVANRKRSEERHRYHGRRGAHEIFYTDIDDLASIIKTYWECFKEIFPSQEWVVARINEIELSRNIVAHNNPLSKRDIRRLKVYFDDWLRQIIRR